MIATATRALVEGLSPTASDPVTSRNSYAEFLAAMLAFAIAIVLISFLGKWLWNEVVVELFSVAKPAKSVWQVLGLFLFVSLICPH
jgi:hypothetical protein